MRIVRCVATTLIAAAFAHTADAVNADDFYNDRQIRLIVATAEGGSYDFVGRLVGRHIGRHIPGAPRIVVQNMPGAASLIAANHVYNVAPQDGSVISVVNQGIPQAQLFGDKNAKYDAGKFNWIGNPTAAPSVLAVWHTTPVKAIAEAFDKPLNMGSAGRSSMDASVVLLMNNVLGTKFKLVLGYKGGNEMELAMERGEISGRAGQSWTGWKITRPDWVKDGKIRILTQVGLERAADLPDVPLLTELAGNDEQRSILGLITNTAALGRPFVAGPGVPADRVAILRSGFKGAMGDPQLLEEARKSNFEVAPIFGEQLQTVVQRIMATPPEIAKKAEAAMAAEK